MPKKSNTRTRTLKSRVPGDGYEIKLSTGKKTPVGSDLISDGRQYTVSEGHDASKDGKYREGGPFYTYLTQRHVGFTNVVCKGELFGTKYEYHGPIHTPVTPDADMRLSTQNEFRPLDTSDLDPYGATAIARCAPTNPASTLSIGLGEIMKDGLPSIPIINSWKSRLGLAKAAGSEYLNAVFGFLPLKNEIEEVSDAVRHQDELLKQFNRDAGKPVRRDYEFEIERSVTEKSVPGYAAFPNYSNPMYASPSLGVLTNRVETTVRRWFVGAFTYPPLPKDDFLDKVETFSRQANAVFGTTITPDVLWELTPWSWAVDWFSNTGDVIHNASQFHQFGLMMRYGYIMEEKTTKITNTLDRAALKGCENRSVPPSWTLYRSKVRRPASPFGFGIAWEDLSPSQLAITAAIGITRWL